MSDLLNKNIDVNTAPIFRTHLIGLSLQPLKHFKSPTQQNSTSIIPILSKPVSYNSSTILIARLDVHLPLISSNLKRLVKTFDDECVCIADLLDTTDKRVYFIVSSSVGEYIIPLIYRHYCIEQIYIYCSDDNQRNASWINRFPKIRSCWTNYELLLTAVHDDIQSIFSPSSLWSNVELMKRCYTQTLIDLPNYQSASLDIFNIEKYSILYEQIYIVVLHCDSDTLFHPASERFHLSEFSDVIECVKYLGKIDVKSVFFIISGDIKSIKCDIKSITILNQIYAIYLFVEMIDEQELNDTIQMYINIGRLFDNLEFLLNCLTADIKLRFEQLLYMPSVSTFTLADNTIDNEKLHLTVEQKKFAAFQFFVNTLREAPPFIHGSQQIYDRCLALAENKSDGERALKILKTDKDQVFEWFVNEPFLSLIINSFLQEQFPENLLNIQQILVDIDQSFVDVSPTTSSAVVYRVQLLREQDLKILQENVNELITFHAYLLTTKDLLTARSIARQAADRRLLVIIFQIEIPSYAYVLQLDNNRLMFRFGTIFRIQSIDSAPDNVWYVELKNDDSDFQSIQERLQLQMGEQLTWLTLGNYLCALDHFDEAKCYYKYLLNALPEDHQALPSIYNNMGLIFARLDDHKQALEHYKISIDLLNKVSSNANHTSESISFKTLSQSAETKVTTDCHALYNRMSEVHLQQSQHEEALECYRKALELSTDPLSRLRYELKIKSILSSK